MSGEIAAVSAAAGAVVAVLAAAMSGALIVLLYPLLKRYALAKPNARSSHRTPTPQGAGIAVIAATVAAILIAAGLRWFGLRICRAASGDHRRGGGDGRHRRD